MFRRDEAPWFDFAFEVAGERITMHRAVMAARSPFMRKMLLTDWLLPVRHSAAPETYLEGISAQPCKACQQAEQQRSGQRQRLRVLNISVQHFASGAW